MAKQKNRKPRVPKQEAFLAAYAKCGNVTEAAKMAKISRTSHANWLKDDPLYPTKFDEAHEQACDSLESEARRRAVTGTLKPVYQGGKKVGTIREFSDVLLIFLMKGAMPEKYRERQSLEIGGRVAHTLQVVQDEGWYGNNSHTLAAQAAATPNADLIIAGPHEAAGVRPTMGQDGDGLTGGIEGARAIPGSAEGSDGRGPDLVDGAELPADRGQPDLGEPEESDRQGLD